MKTIIDFLPQLFKTDAEKNVQKVSARIEKLSGISQSTSAFWNTVSIAKTVTSERDSADIATSIFTDAANIQDVTFPDVIHQEYEDLVEYYKTTPNADVPTDETSLTLAQTCEALATYINDEINVIGYYRGVPITAVNLNRRANPYAETSQYVPYQNEILFFYGDPVQIYPYSETRKKAFLIIEQQTWETFIYNRVFTYSDDPDNIFTFPMPHIHDDGTVTMDGPVSLDSLLNSFTNDYISNECLSNIIARAQSDGVVSRDQVESIINQYESTSMTSTLKTMIAGTGRLDFISLITLIGTLYKRTGADYSDSSSKEFSVFEAPNYITSVIQLVVNVLITTIIAILGILFRAIGVIISMISSVIQSVVNLIKGNVTKTEAKVTEMSFTPIYNNPLLTFQMTVGAMNQWITNSTKNSVSLDDIDAILDEHGCAMITPSYEGSAPYYYWILPRDKSDDNSRYVIQVLVSASQVKRNVIVPEPFPVYSAQPGLLSYTCSAVDKQTIGITTAKLKAVPINTVSDVSTLNYVADDDTQFSYLVASDVELRKNVTINALKAVHDIFLMDDTDNTTYIFGTGDGLVIDDIMNMNTQDIDLGLCNFKNLFGVIKDSESGGGQTFSIIQKIKLIATFGSYRAQLMASTVNAWAPDEWDDITNFFSLVSSSTAYTETYIPTRSNVWDPAKAINDTLNNGRSISKCAVEWPNVSKTALVNLLVVSAVTALAISAVAVTAKIAFKRIAFNKLSSRQASFDDAKKKYDDMNKDLKRGNLKGYTKDDIANIRKDYYKANKKLTRAWAFAGKFGLSMYNGFSTSSDSLAYSDAPSDIFSSMTSAIQSDIATPSENQDASIDNNSILQALAKIIAYK